MGTSSSLHPPHIPLLPLLLLTTILSPSTPYEIGCIYPPSMLEPFSARAKIIGFTGVYSSEGGLETPVSIHQAQAFSYCDVNCLAHHDSLTLNAITNERPTVVVPEGMGHNSWSRMMCIAQCYSVFFAREGNVEALETIRDTWKLDVLPMAEPTISENFRDDYGRIEAYISSAEIDYDPLAIGRLVSHEIILHTETDGWNSAGSHRYDPLSATAVPCTANCVPYRDTTGYQPRNHPGLTTDTEETKHTVDGTNTYWQPLMEDNGKGYITRQEHVTPHIGFTARHVLRDPSTHTPLPAPSYDYHAESLLVLDRLRSSATDTTKWDKISFYDKKFLVRLLIQESLRLQYGNARYSFEDELLFTHGISAGEHDAVLAAWREKVTWDLVRPTTVIQRWGGEVLEGMYDGNRDMPGIQGEVAAGDMRAFARVMPHSEYPSGSSCICEVYREFTDLYTSRRFGGRVYNLTDMYWGYGGVDFGCDERSLLDPSRADFLGCKQGGFEVRDMDHLAKECAESRLWGGMHFTASVGAGTELCKGLGTLGWERMETLRNGSGLGSVHVKGGERPVCSWHTESPTGGPTESPVEVIRYVDEGDLDGGGGGIVYSANDLETVDVSDNGEGIEEVGSGGGVVRVGLWGMGCVVAVFVWSLTIL